jgi:RHS repeat-associated protein
VGGREAATATLMKASVAAGSNRITGTTTLAGATARTLSWRTGGEINEDARAGAATYDFGYNAARRIRLVNQNGSAAGSYAYDFAGRRVWRRTYGTGALQTVYVYDQEGHLLAEHDAVSGAVRREYVWIDDLPIALADISGSTVTVSSIHTGQIDEPLAVTSQAQALVWNGYVDPTGNGSTFGAPTLSPPLDMRLPGQSYQAETGGLSQNGWRDYDPSLGRYVEADPLGIDAGQNIYGYVDGDPLNGIDPSGLICISGVGCYTTPAESRAANSGDYKSYYNMACAGGDSYACFAGNVANNQGILGHVATAKVLSALAKKEMRTKSCIDEDRVLEEIRKALARDYANYLPQSRSSARYPSASGVADFHQDVFESLGLPPTTFGGTPFDPNVLVLPQVWCPNCRP